MSGFTFVPSAASVGLAVVVAIAVAPPTSAATLTHEEFDYTVSTGLSGKNNANAGWAGAWFTADPQPFTVESGSLSDPTGTLVTSGHHTASTVQLSNVNKGVSMGRTFDAGTQAALGTGADAWISFLIRRDANALTTGGSDAHEGMIGIGNAEQYQPNFGIGANLDATGAGTWQIFQGTATYADSGVPVTVGETVLLVVRMQFDATKKPTSTIWVNPTPGLTAPVDPGVTGTHPKTFSFSGNFSLGGRAYSFDEIRIGASYADVTPSTIPEPASLALLALGGMLMAGRRRKA